MQKSEITGITRKFIVTVTIIICICSLIAGVFQAGNNTKHLSLGYEIETFKADTLNDLLDVFKATKNFP